MPFPCFGYSGSENLHSINYDRYIALISNNIYVQIAFTLVVFPCLLLGYTGQAAYIIVHKDHVVDAFYRSIPGPHTKITVLCQETLSMHHVHDVQIDIVHIPPFLLFTSAVCTMIYSW